MWRDEILSWLAPPRSECLGRQRDRLKRQPRRPMPMPRRRACRATAISNGHGRASKGRARDARSHPGSSASSRLHTARETDLLARARSTARSANDRCGDLRRRSMCPRTHSRKHEGGTARKMERIGRAAVDGLRLVGQGKSYEHRGDASAPWGGGVGGHCRLTGVWESRVIPGLRATTAA